MAFDCTIERRDDTITVVPEGDLGLENTAVMREVLRKVVETLDGGRIDVDMGQVNFLDSSGIGMLVAAQRAAAAKGTTLMLREPNAMIRMVLEIANLDRTLVADTVAD